MTMSPCFAPCGKAICSVHGCLRVYEARLEAEKREREKPPPKPPRKTKAQLEQELVEERKRSERLESENKSLRRSRRTPDYSYFGLGDGPT